MTAIKVNRIKLIDSLNQAITDREQDIVRRKTEWEAYNKAVDIWVAKVVKHHKSIGTGRGEYAWLHNGEVRLLPPKELPIPETPTDSEPQAKRYYGNGRSSEYQTYTGFTGKQIDEIRNTIRLLEMSDEDSVNASVYKSVMQYL